VIVYVKHIAATKSHTPKYTRTYFSIPTVKLYQIEGDNMNHAGRDPPVIP